MPHESDDQKQKRVKPPEGLRPSSGIKPDTKQNAQQSSAQSGSSMNKFNAALRKILSVPKKNIK